MSTEGLTADTPPILQADQFLRSAGIIGNVQKNNLVLTTLCACPKLSRVAFDIDTRSKKMIAYLELNRWNWWFASRSKMVDTLTSIYSDYLPEYSFTFKFKPYERHRDR